MIDYDAMFLIYLEFPICCTEDVFSINLVCETIDIIGKNSDNNYLNLKRITQSIHNL